MDHLKKCVYVLPDSKYSEMNSSHFEVEFLGVKTDEGDFFLDGFVRSNNPLNRLEIEWFR